MANEIKKLKIKHNCKSVVELVKSGVNVNLSFYRNIRFKHAIDMDELTNLMDNLPEELPVERDFHGVADVVTYMEIFNRENLNHDMSILVRRSDLISDLLKYNRYDKVVYLLTRDHTFYGWEKKRKMTLKFRNTIKVYDEKIYELLDKCKTPKSENVILSQPEYTPYIGVVTNDNLETVIETLLKVTDKNVLYVFRDEIINKGLVLTDYDINLYNIVYEFYYVFHKLLFEWNVKFIICKFKNTTVGKHIIISKEGATLDSYSKIYNCIIYPSKYDLMENYSSELITYIPYLEYKYNKYSNNREIDITDALKLLRSDKSLDYIVEDNYFCPTNSQLSRICDNESDVDLIIAILPKSLVRIHLLKCTNKNCTIKRFSITRTKRAI